MWYVNYTSIKLENFFNRKKSFLKDSDILKAHVGASLVGKLSGKESAY